MKIYLRKNERFLGESILELLPVIREVNQFEYDKPLKLDKKYLDLLWIEVAETEDVNVFDVYDEYEEAEKMHLPLTHGLLVTGDIVEKNGKYVILGDHIQNGIVDFGDIDPNFNIFADEDLWNKGYHSIDEQLPSMKSDSQYGRNRSEKSKDKDCVSKWISKLTDEGVGEGKRWKNHEQVVAVAHSKCGLSKKSEVVDDFDYYNEMLVAVPIIDELPPQDEPYSEHYTFTYEYDNDWEWAKDYDFQKFEDVNVFDLKVNPDFALHPEDVKNGSPRVRKDTLYYYAVETTEMRPFIVDPNYNLIDGHHRLYAIMDKNQRNIRVAIVTPKEKDNDGYLLSNEVEPLVRELADLFKRETSWEQLNEEQKSNAEQFIENLRRNRIKEMNLDQIYSRGNQLESWVDGNIEEIKDEDLATYNAIVEALVRREADLGGTKHVLKSAQIRLKARGQNPKSPNIPAKEFYADKSKEVDESIETSTKSAVFVESQHPRGEGGKFSEKTQWVKQLLKILPKWETAQRGTSRTVSLGFVDKYFETDFELDINIDNWDNEEVFEEFTDLSQLCVDLDSAYEETNAPSKKRKITELQIMYTEVREVMVKEYAKVIEMLESIATKADLTQDEMIEIIKELMDLDLPSLKELKQRLERLKRPAQERI